MNTQPPSIGQSVLERIQTEAIRPTKRSWFTCRECLFRSAWFATMVLGSIAVAVLLYTGISGWFGFYEAMDTTKIGLVLLYMPVFWLLTLLLAGLLAHINIRRTKRGYRYELWQIVLISILVSSIGGSLLYGAGFGHYVDKKLGEQMPQYNSYYEQQELFWQTPSENRWLGTLSDNDTQTFTDQTNQVWQLEMAGLSDAEQSLLRSGKLVRLLGIMETNEVVTVCSVFPWNEDKAMMPMYLAEERALLSDGLTKHQQATSSCADLPML